MAFLIRMLRRPRMRKRRIIVFFIFSALVYFVYQFGFISELSDPKKGHKYSPLRDMNPGERQNNINPHKLDGRDFNSDKSAKDDTESRTFGTVFKCRKSKKLISSDKVNDDYCDCPEDGSDEFLTDACDGTFFHCREFRDSFPSRIPSSFVNDGVCDCCDGSDEWQEKSIISLPQDFQKKIHRYVSPCPVLC